MLALLLFNWCGYRLLTAYLEQRANTQLQADLDENNYEESQLVSIKIPAVHLGYYSNSSQFERTDGQIEIGGVQYNYVKRRIYKDTLEFLCIPNRAAMSLQTAKDEFFRLVNDLRHTGHSKHGDTVKPFTSDLFTFHDPIQVGSLGQIGTEPSFPFASALSSCASLPAEQPPDAAAIRA